MTKRLSLVLAAALIGGVLAASASAQVGGGTPLAPGTVVASYTGCLSPILSVVYDVAAGDLPAHPPCRPPASVIHLSSGDLTSLTAGTGLTGGGDNGDVSVGIAPSYRLPQGCTSGQAAGWNGTAWTCASFASQAALNSLVLLLSSPGTINDSSNPVDWTKLKGVPAGFADGTDDVGPSYTAGSGLNLAGTTFSVDPASVQSRVDGTCPAGSSIGGIAQDGSVTCRGHASYSAGEGLALTGGEFRVADGQVTPAKLSFDPTTQTEFDSFATLIGSTGTINDPSNPLSWTQLQGIPAAFADGTDDAGLTSVAVGTGLTGSGTSGDVLQVVAPYRMPQSCGSGQVPKWNGASWGCGNDNEGTGGGTTGHSPAANDISTLDSAGAVGEDASVTVGTDGLGLVSYYDASNRDLKVAHCANTACTSATLATLDSAGVVGQDTSITIGADGLGLVSYYDNSNRDLKVAHCADAACTTATVATTLDSAGDVGLMTSVTIGADGLGLVSYYDRSNQDLKLAHCANVACTSGTLATLATNVSASMDPARSSVTIGADGLGLVSYYDVSLRDLKLVHCEDTACTSHAPLATLDSTDDVGFSPSVTIGTDGLGLVSYLDATNGDLKVAHCANAGCTTATLATLDSAGVVGYYSSITIGTDGLGLVSYYDVSNGDLKLAHCANAACTSATLATLDSVGVSGLMTSVTVGADGFGLVSYWDVSNGDLKVAHLSNAFGVPYFRRR